MIILGKAGGRAGDSHDQSLALEAMRRLPIEIPPSAADLGFIGGGDGTEVEVKNAGQYAHRVLVSGGGAGMFRFLWRTGTSSRSGPRRWRVPLYHEGRKPSPTFRA